VDSSHRPYADVRITHCGELVLLKKSKSSESLAYWVVCGLGGGGEGEGV
jgi:hypothetical protein